jgi:signal transduction histidine kinase
LPGDVGLHLFRIVQEAINNIEKHAEAKSVKLRIRFQGDAVILKIQDDGRGFKVKALGDGPKGHRGLGFTNMRERALSLGGICTVSSFPGRGTTVVVRIPLELASKGPAAKTSPGAGKVRARK